MSTLRTDAENEHLNLVQLALSSIQADIALTVKAICSNKEISVFLDTLVVFLCSCVYPCVKGDSSSFPPTSRFLSQDLATIRGCLGGDILLGGHESLLVKLRLAGVHDVCEAISVPETLRVKNLCL